MLFWHAPISLSLQTTDSGVYHRVAATAKDYVSFIPWDNEPKDLLVQSQHEIFKAYKLNPHAHELPPSYHEDSVWSQELLRRLLNGEGIPRGCTTYRPRGGLFGEVRYLCLNIHAFPYKVRFLISCFVHSIGFSFYTISLKT